MESILTVQNLSVTLGEEEILHHLNLSVEPGESVAIIGPNGSGKTTLIRALIGSVAYAGNVTWAPSTKIGYVPQKLDIERDLPLSLHDFLSTKQNVHEKELHETLALVHVKPELLSKPLGALSGGEFQRALIAFALLGNP